MHRRMLKLCAGLVVAVLAARVIAQTAADRKDDKPAAGGVAVVELFTSEGCSSCPPADRVLSELRAKAKKAGSNIFFVAYHVDYWNRLGWTDRFSSAAATDRQRNYAEALHLQSTYTPQMIVNGTVEFVGSEAQRADEAISQALAQPAALAPVVTIANRKAGEPVSMAIAVLKAPKGAQVCAVLTEDGLSTQVKAGENSGRTLKHDAVARATALARLDDDGKCVVTLAPPAEMNESNASLLVYVQDQRTMRVLGARAVSLSEKAEPVAASRRAE